MGTLQPLSPRHSWYVSCTCSRMLGSEIRIAPKLPPSLFLSLYPPHRTYKERSDPPAEQRVTPNAPQGRQHPGCAAGRGGTREPPGHPGRWAEWAK